MSKQAPFSRRRFLHFAALGAAGAAFAACQPKTTVLKKQVTSTSLIAQSQGITNRANVLFILSDDQGPWAAGCYGNPEIRTPNLDRLADTGTRLERFFVAPPVCSPSRATLLTGRLPSQHGVHDWIRDGNIGPDAIRYLEGEICYTDLLARHGWTCGFLGKRHLGDNQNPQHGFTDWFALQADGGPYNDAPMARDGQLVTEPGYVTDVITDEALRMIERYAGPQGADLPFYLGVHYTAPRAPWSGHPLDIVGSYDDCPFDSCLQEPIHPGAAGLTKQHLGNRESLKGYFAAVTAMDASIGRLLDRLEELGLRENTLIVFLSDNGFSCSHHGFWGKGNGTNPRNMYEHSIRVPFIASHPGHVPEGRVETAMVSAYDVMPTLRDYLGLPAPGTEHNLPGKSFASLLRGDPLAGDGRGRSGHESVVIYDEYGPVRMVRTKDCKYVHRHAYGPHELYDLVNDPDERRNLAKERSHRTHIAELKGLMDQWFARYVDRARNGLRQNSRREGQTRLVR